MDNKRRLLEIVKGSGLLDAEDSISLACWLESHGVAANVRCTECKYCAPVPKNKAQLFDPGISICTIGRGDECHGVSTVWADDYCSDGQRKEESGDGRMEEAAERGKPEGKEAAKAGQGKAGRR